MHGVMASKGAYETDRKRRTSSKEKRTKGIRQGVDGPSLRGCGTTR